MMVAYYALIGLVACQRLSELWISRRNARWMLERGGHEVGRGHYPIAVTLHTTFLASLICETSLLHKQPASWWWIPFAAFLLAQALRYWSMISLGHFWNTRIFILPGAELIRRGPYRFLHHPNYRAVVVEIVTLPLIVQAYFTAVIFSILNAVFLTIRIRAEEEALSETTKG